MCGVQWADGFGSLRVQDEQCKPGFLVRVIVSLCMCLVCVYVCNQLDRFPVVEFGGFW
jgi:hypothetical protein